MKLAVGTVLFFLGLAQLSRGQTDGKASPVSFGEAASPRASGYVVLGATPQEEAVVRAQIQIMQPRVLPLRVVFVPYWKYADNLRIFRLHVPKGYISLMFTHLPSRSVFIDADRYVSNDSLGYRMAHELGHLTANSVKEEDAEKLAQYFRRRLKNARKQEPL